MSETKKLDTFKSFSEYVMYWQKENGTTPSYKVIGQDGSDHAPTVTIHISSPSGLFEDNPFFIAKGISKKVAANDWAKSLNR